MRGQDALYQSPRVPHPDIYVIGIDEKALREIGPWSTWNRGIMAQLLDVLNANPSTAPAVIGIDVSYFQNTQPQYDDALADAAKRGGNVVVACEAVFDDVVSYSENGSPYIDKMKTINIDYPFDALKNAAGYGIINTLPDYDGYVRKGIFSAEFNTDSVNSFSYEIYKRYAEKNGLDTNLNPPLDKYNRFAIDYSTLSGDFYGQNSFYSVLNGDIPAAAFANSIVLIGPYATGLMDQYYSPLDSSQLMYGIEIHANIIQAFIEQSFKQTASIGLQAVLIFILSFLAYLLFLQLDPRWSAAVLLLLCGGWTAFAWLAYLQGFIFNLIYVPIAVLVLYVYRMIWLYFVERMRRKTVTDTFKRYMEPSLVEHLLNNPQARQSMCGTKRDIAVLFIDIRGFTTMSEALDALDVVGILNKYLTVVSQAIFNNKGTLDKFIGDAAMAIYNAPLDLYDYTFCAVKTAVDIASHSHEIQQELMEKYGKSVSFGIGVNCGEAIVGNIGATFRMDYTAIGDTVNTAARLESKAQPGQILISQAVYDRLKDRIDANCIGPMQFKGKTVETIVYEVIGLGEKNETEIA